METISAWFKADGSSILVTIIGSALAYYIGSKIISFIVKQLVRGKGRHLPQNDVKKRQNTLSSLVIVIWKIMIIGVALVSIFKILFPDIDLSFLFTSAGIIGIAIAFGAQALVKDFISGLFIVSENQYRIGDFIEVNGAYGKVERLGTRSTVIRDLEGNVHYIPNGTITHVINKTMGYSKIRFTISIDSGTDLDKAIKVINQTGQKIASDKDWAGKIIEAPQFDSLGQFTSKAVDVTIAGKVQPSEQWAVSTETRRRLLKEFETNKIDLA